MQILQDSAFRQELDELKIGEGLAHQLLCWTDVESLVVPKVNMS